MKSFIHPLDGTQATISEVGGKGFNLSRLISAGFPVPPGFVITTTAYHAFVTSNDLYTAIFALLTDQTKSIEETTAAIRLRFEQASFPEDLSSTITSAYTHHFPSLANEAPVPIVVRSSATAEDLVEASFAGQHESYLNVCGEKELLRAVKRCWSSLWAARAIEYRARNTMNPLSVGMAVVVQVMVPARAAGVLFTANPLSQSSDELVIEAAWGLGEAVVSGLTTTDQIIVNRVTGAIQQITVGDKAVMTVPVGAGTAERDVDTHLRRMPVLSKSQVSELASMSAAIEAFFGTPQDIEWCAANGKFHIVQSRPITTFPPRTVYWESPIPGAKWQKDAQAAEWVTEPLSPLGATTTLAAMVSARQTMRTWPPVPKVRAPWSTLINGWFYQRVDHQPISVYSFLLGGATCFFFGGLDGHRQARKRWPSSLAELDALEHVDLSTLSEKALLAHADWLLAALGWWWREVTWFAAIGRSCSQLIGALHVDDLADPNALFIGNDSLMIGAERTLRQAAANPDKVQDFLLRFGHAIESADPIHLTLRESPQHLTWQFSAAHENNISPDQRLAKARSWRRAAEEAVKRVSGLRGFLARRLLAIGQSYSAHTDDAVFHFQRVIAAIRKTFLAVGEQFTRAGILSRAEDVFFLERNELHSVESEPAQQTIEKVAHRRALREQQKRLVPPPFIPPISDPVWAKDAFFQIMPASVRLATGGRGLRERGNQHVLVGSPGSAGRASGIARVIHGPEDFNRFHKGDILVTRTTSPIWTSLLGIAAAAVTEVGGPFAHAAIVAREYGIPLVDGALDATHVIKDGTPVTVDGSAGIVEIEITNR